MSKAFIILWFCTVVTIHAIAQSGVESQAYSEIKPESIKATMSFLADDLLEGRQPGSKGFSIASKYVESRFTSMGLVPGVDGKTYLQKIPFRKAVVEEAASSLRLLQKDAPDTLIYGKHFIFSPDFFKLDTDLSSQLVFVGFGVSAPELGYDDYKKIDVSGKIVVMMGQAPDFFPSNERAYFASAPVKYAEAIKRGAKVVIAFSLPDDKRTSWDALVRRAKTGSLKWLDGQGIPSNAYGQLQGVVQFNPMYIQALFSKSGKDIKQVYAQAKAGKPQSFPLNMEVEMRTKTKHIPVESSNLIGIIPGSDSILKNEYVVYAAHLDHFGVGTSIKGDSIYNGAHDNASGIAILLGIAGAFKALPQSPKRSIIIAAVTGEEWGLLGSDYFASNPTVKSESMVANLSIDMPFFFYPLLDIVPYGIQHSSLAKQVTEAASTLNLKISPDPIPEQVIFMRSDHFSFIKKGIPSLFVKSGFITGNPDVDGAKVNADWRREIYHTPQDDMNQAFDFDAAVKHAQFNFLVGYMVANDINRPTWNKGDFFGNKFGRKK